MRFHERSCVYSILTIFKRSVFMAEWQDSVSSSPPLADSDNETESTNVMPSSGRRPGSKHTRLSLRDRALARRRRASDSSDASKNIMRMRDHLSGSMNEKYQAERESEDQQFISIKVPSRRGSQKPSRPASNSCSRTTKSADDAKDPSLMRKRQSQQPTPSRCCLLL